VNDEIAVRSQRVGSIVRASLALAVIDGGRLGDGASVREDPEASGRGRLRDRRVEHDRGGVGRDAALTRDQELPVRVGGEGGAPVRAGGISGIYEPAGGDGIEAVLGRLLGGLSGRRHEDPKKKGNGGRKLRAKGLRPSPATGPVRRTFPKFVQLDLDQGRRMQGADLLPWDRKSLIHK